MLYYIQAYYNVIKKIILIKFQNIKLHFDIAGS